MRASTVRDAGTTSMADASRFACGNDAVATRPRLSHEARGLSGGCIDVVEAVWHRIDAIAATTSSSSSFLALSHSPQPMFYHFFGTHFPELIMHSGLGREIRPTMDS